MLGSKIALGFVVTLLILGLFVQQEVSADPVPCDEGGKKETKKPEAKGGKKKGGGMMGKMEKMMMGC